MSEAIENIALFVALMAVGIGAVWAVLAVYVYWLETNE